MTAAHRSWRIKVFVATWLSYVGFYFCRKPFSAAKAAIGDRDRLGLRRRSATSGRRT